jgi:3-oxoacyl-(acyl-carrier-protein) synthase
VADDDSKKKIGKVDNSKTVKRVDTTEAVEKTSGVGGVQSVTRVEKAGSITSAGRIVSEKERQRLLRMVEEEAEDLLNDSGLSKKKKDIIKDAVAIAIDSGLIVKERDEP